MKNNEIAEINSTMNGGNTMNMNEFASTLAENMERHIGRPIHTDIREVIKVNDQRRLALVISEPGITAAPTIYLESFYEELEGGKTFDDICEEIKTIYQENSTGPENMLVSELEHFDSIKHRICYKLINASRNKDFLKDIPFVLFENLAIIFYILLDVDSDGSASITVNNKMMKDMWGTTTDELFQLARENTQHYLPGSITSIGNVLSEMMGIDDAEYCDEASDNLFVCTNASKVNGAVTMLYDGLLKDFARAHHVEQFFILPSSVHEVLLMPWSEDITVKDLEFMVREVNRTEVAAADYLSDNVYLYDAASDQVTLA